MEDNEFRHHCRLKVVGARIVCALQTAFLLEKRKTDFKIIGQLWVSERDKCWLILSLMLVCSVHMVKKA